jgi:hypothetical protein
VKSFNIDGQDAQDRCDVSCGEAWRAFCAEEELAGWVAKGGGTQVARRRGEGEGTDEHDGHVYLIERAVYQLVRCRGCENVSLQRTCTISGSPEEEVDYFPPAVSRRTPIWISDLSWLFDDTKHQLRELFREVYSAVHSGNYRLAMMGTRAIVDVALTDKLGDIGGFEKKLKVPSENGWISIAQLRPLSAAVEAGNAASHRAYKPDENQLNLVLDVVENFIHLLYVQEENAIAITKKTPTRQRKGNSTAGAVSPA